MEKVPSNVFGKLCRDAVNGFEGIAVGVVDWMFGCQSVTLEKQSKKPSKRVTEDVSVKKLQIIGDGLETDMDIPAYEPPKYFGKIARDKVTGYEGMVIGRFAVFYSSDRYVIQAKVKKNQPVEPIVVDEGRLEIIEDSELAISPDEVQTERTGGVDFDFSQYL